MRQAITTVPAGLARTITWIKARKWPATPLHHRHLHPGVILRRAQALADPGGEGYALYWTHIWSSSGPV